MKYVKKDIVIKKLLYQSKNRGFKETDILLGRFAEKFLPLMNEQELEDFALILMQNDADIYDWITKKTKVPTHLSSKVMNLLLKFDLKQ